VAKLVARLLATAALLVRIQMANLVARLLASAALWVRIQTSLKNTKWATKAKEWPTHSSPPKKYTKTTFFPSQQVWIDTEKKILSIFNFKTKEIFSFFLPTYIAISSKPKSRAPRPPENPQRFIE
jgi:hypothetical protein